MKRPGDLFPVKDKAKVTLFLPKLLLESTFLWPEKVNIYSRIVNILTVILCFLIEAGQVAFVVKNIHDLTKIASAISTISTTFQAITKILPLYFFSARLRKVLARIWYDFWAYDIVEPSLANKIKVNNSLLITGNYCMCFAAIIFAFGFLSSPLRHGERILPFESVYPFDWTETPAYEIIYICQWIANLFFIVIPICGHDYLFWGICANIVTQYTLLTEMFRNLGSENVERLINDKFGHMSRNRFKCSNEQLLEICVNHHQMLVEVCEDVEKIFAFSLFIQMFASIVSLCIAAVIVTFGDAEDTALLTTIIVYLLGHLLQLFFYCALGNEIMYKAGTLSRCIFGSRWYTVESQDFDKKLLFVLLRSQRNVKLSAMGIATLDYSTFISVLRSSFSFYTMLSTVTESKQITKKIGQ